MSEKAANQGTWENGDITLLPQSSPEDGDFWTNNVIGKFDGFSLLLLSFATLLVVASVVISFLTPRNILLSISIACFSAVFTTLAIRETKRNREAKHAPTLFFATQNSSELGLKNIGNGPAHELKVEIEDEGGDTIAGNPPQNAVVEVGSFISLELEPGVDTLREQEEFVRVEMSYSDCLGDQHPKIVRQADFIEWNSD